MTEDEVRDRCCWKHCRHESTLIYLGAGICDAHFETACAIDNILQTTAEYVYDHLIPAGRSAMQHHTS